MALFVRRTTTKDNPLIIPNPSLALVNLADDEGRVLMDRDCAVLRDVFGNNVEIADRTVPKCNVLFLYCASETSECGAGSSSNFRNLTREAGAHITVIASESQPSLLSNPEFKRALLAKGDWRANIVITLNRNGEHFARFFHRLFSLMLAGTTMPMAWVELAPQGPQQQRDIPGTICLMEAGHIAFGHKKP